MAGGFTLIELMISLILLSLVLALVYGSFFQISRGAAGLEERLTERQELRLLLKMVSDDLQAAQWLEGFWQGGQAAGRTRPTGIIARVDSASGRETSVVNFHAAVPTRFYRRVPPERDPDLHEVGYSVRPGEDGQGLELVRREDFYLDDDLEHGGISVPLADHMETFLVEFLTPQEDPHAQERWQKEWDSPNQPAGSRMPRAIRLTIGRTGKNGDVMRDTLEINLNASLRGR